uniref:Uncharacterized protein n=1 Tax=Sciurus vulgaris TaxID=55149 RepID=A0A8D2JS75_SCIVU
GPGEAGWASWARCLASVWLVQRMWMLRSPLIRLLCMNMTTGPGGRQEGQPPWVARKRFNVSILTRSVSETA